MSGNMFEQSTITFLQEYVKVHQWMHWFILKSMKINCFTLKFSHHININEIEKLLYKIIEKCGRLEMH